MQQRQQLGHNTAGPHAKFNQTKLTLTLNSSFDSVFNIMVETFEKETLKKVGIGLGIGVAAGVAAPLVATAALGAAGFSAGGVVAGSLAAAIQASIGNVAAGSFFACKSNYSCIYIVFNHSKMP